MKRRSFYMVLAIAVTATALFSQDMADYCSVPPFVGNLVPPNVLIILDNSGSMLWAAYDNDDSPSNIASGYDSTRLYYGIFDPEKRYNYVGTHSDGYFKENDHGNWSGNFLNWVTMIRWDIARKVLTGGRVETEGSDMFLVADPYPRSYQNRKYHPGSGVSPHPEARYWGRSGPYLYVDDDSYMYSSPIARYRVRIKITESPQGILQRTASGVRYGLMFFNNDQGGYISTYIRDSYDYYGGMYHIDRIISTVNKNLSDYSCSDCVYSTWTPLAEALHEAYRFYSQQSPYYYYSDFTRDPGNPTYDPYYINDPITGAPIPVPCRRSFIIIVTDGESTQDRDIPSYLQDTDGDGNDPVPAGQDPGDYPWASDGSDYLDDVAFYIHINDIRSDIGGPWTQNITLYAVRAFGIPTVMTLRDAAINGGFIDRNGNDVPDLQEEWDEDGDSIPDTYFEAPSGYELEDALLRVITDILRRNASGTAIAVLATSSRGEGTVNQAYFKPSLIQGGREIHWLGYLNSLWVDPYGNLREDANSDKKLTLTADNIVEFVFNGTQTVLERYQDADGDGEKDTDYPYEVVMMDNMRPLWNGGLLLAQKSPTDRHIYTHLGNLSRYDFNYSHRSTLRPFLNVSTDEEAGNVIRYVLGEDLESYGFRDRTVNVGGTDYEWKLGDIVNSSPTYVGTPMERFDYIYGDDSYAQFYQHYKERRNVVYAGGNDGMLHAFNAGRYIQDEDPNTPEIGRMDGLGKTLGEELWGFIPYNLLPQLKWLGDPNYCHIYYVDMRPKASDVRIFSASSTHPQGWGTILITGMRLGGKEVDVTDNFGSGNETRTFRSAYLALDVTDPEVPPEPMWEFTDSSLGFTSTYPAIARLGDPASQGNWYMIVGSGPQDFQGLSTRRGKLYVVDIADGSLLTTFDIPEESSFVGNPITVDVDLDYKTDCIYFGTCRKEGGHWRGKMYRLATHENPDPTTWTLSVLIDADHPTTAAPSVAMDDKGNLWVFWGTGRYISDQDEEDPDVQVIFGVKDPCWDGSCTTPIYLNDLFNATSVRVTRATGGGDVQVEVNLSSCGIPAGTYAFDVFEQLMEYCSGWYIVLSPGERVLSKPAVMGGAVILPTFTPSGDICAYGGSSNLFAIFYKTGTAYREPIFSGNRGVQDIGGGREEIMRETDIGEGVPSSQGIHVGKSGETKGFIQLSTGQIVGLKETLPYNVSSRTLLWREKE